MRRRKLIGWVWLAALFGPPMADAAVSVYLSPEDLSARTPLIVEARVLDSRSGLDPTDGALNTYVTLTVDHTLRGPERLTELVLREPGGSWGELIHQVDAVPVYRPGERVLAYLEPAADGSLRTVGMFFGKFRLADDQASGPLRATRDLEGQGTILGRSDREETVTRNDLVSLAATIPSRSRLRAWSSRPPEWDRLAWSPEELSLSSVQVLSPFTAIDVAVKRIETSQPAFAPLSAANPTRWAQTDSGTTVTMNVQPAGNPLGDDAASIFEIGRALAAWTDVSASRLALALGDTNHPYTSSYASPASNYSGINIVLFDDPYDDISDPTGCGGVLAIGGYWRSGSTGAPVNGVAFHPALQMYVIFNNNFECYLANPDNLAEVAAHELGHGLGFGHSGTSDAIMRSSAYGNRGPRLGDDDIDAAHCHYPHTLNLSSPNGGEQWTAGSVANVTWTVTTEAGGDHGSVNLEYSTDGGSTWMPLANGVSNDGSQAVTVPDDPGTDVRVRVLRPSRTAVPPPYPVDACSSDMSDSALTIAAAPAGTIGDGLRIEKNGSMIRLRWPVSCSATADDYAIYEGTLAGLRSGAWDAVPASCSAGTDLIEDIAPGNGSLYYLVAVRAGSAEGSLGSDTTGQPRPESALACAPREADSTCAP